MQAGFKVYLIHAVGRPGQAHQLTCSGPALHQCPQLAVMHSAQLCAGREHGLAETRMNAGAAGTGGRRALLITFLSCKAMRRTNHRNAMLPSASGRLHGHEFACAGTGVLTSTPPRTPWEFGPMARLREVLQPLATTKGFPRL